MKKLLAFLSGIGLAIAAFGQPGPVNPRPATQAQVNAGTDAFDFVTPLTLTGASGSYTLSPYYNPTPDSGTVVNVANVFAVQTLSSTPTTVTFSGAPAKNYQTWQRLFVNSTATTITVNVPSVYSFNAGGTVTSFIVQPFSSEWIYWSWNGSTYCMWGDPRTVNDLTATSGALPSDLIGVYPVATSGIMVKEPISAANIHHVVFVFNGSGGTISVGAKAGTFIKAPYGGKLIGWTATCYPADTFTVDILRAASGGGYAGLATITGSGTKPNVNPAGVSTTENSGTSFTNWGSTTITAGDLFEASVTAVMSAQYATIDLYWE